MIIFFSLSDWAKFGTQSPPHWLQADNPACPQALLTSQKHSRIFTQKMQGAPSLAREREAGIVSHTIQGMYLPHCSPAVFKNRKCRCYYASPRALLQPKSRFLPAAPQKTNTATFFLGSSLSLIHMVMYMHQLLHTMEFFWPRAYKTNSRSASPRSVYCVTAGCSVKRAAPVKGREKNVM